ncbi:MAG: hypothetical protein E3J71_09530 [Candidatus Stahlbacteria bacterium]|nr:MAG: hypothetical protein E3J71_09530 [Candidatus Stahlbacteria bacterium]
MILPTKRLGQDRALLYVGAEILKLLDHPKTISRVWDELKKTRSEKSENPSLTYDWFVLALDLLYTVGCIEFETGRLRKRTQ